MSHVYSVTELGPVTADEPPYQAIYSITDCPVHGPEWEVKEQVNGCHPARIAALLADQLHSRLVDINEVAPAPPAMQGFITALGGLIVPMLKEYAEKNERAQAERRLADGRTPDHP